MVAKVKGNYAAAVLLHWQQAAQSTDTTPPMASRVIATFKVTS